MKVREFQIHRYGPLSASGRMTLAAFNLFWGENEDGKTLTLEALVKMLFGKTAQRFNGFDRVTEDPEGFLVLEDSEAREIKSGTANLPDILALSPESCRNLFVIRNSDLAIEREEELYADLTEKLTGLQKTRIQKMKARLRETAGLTPQLAFTDIKETGRLKSRIAKAETLLSDISRFLEEAERQGMGALEESFVDLQEQLDRTDRAIRHMEAAIALEELQRYRGYLERWRQLSQERDARGEGREEDYQQWIEAENRAQDLLGELASARDELHTLEKRKEEGASGLAEEESRLKLRQKRQREIDERIKPLLDKRTAAEVKYQQRKAYRPYSLAVCCFFTLLLLVSVVGLIFAPDIFPGVLAASAALAAAVWAGHLLVFVRIGSVIRALEAGILGEAAGLGLEAEAVAALSAKLRELADELAELEDHFKNGKTQCTILEHDCDRAGEALKKIQENQRVVQGAIRDMQNRLGLEDVSQLKGRLAEKRTLQDEENTLKVLLKERLPSAWSGDTEAASEEGAETALMARVEQQLLRDVARAASLRQEEPGFQDGLSFGTGPASEAELSSLKEKRVQLNDQLEQIRHDLQQYRSSLAGFQEAINGILERYEERVYVRSLPDLKAGCARLEEWTTRVLRQRENAVAAHAILDEIEQDEEKKVAELFGEGSAVSAFFKNVTQGTYTQVFYDPESMKIRAQRMDGKSVSAEQLSGGAYDQLYFSIRMALASRLLPDEKAFFLLDDPFVKSDTGRLTKQLHMLLELSRQGWQVLYFSAKDEVKEILKPALKKGDITQQPVPTVIFKGLPKSSDSPVPEEHRKRDI